MEVTQQLGGGTHVPYVRSHSSKVAWLFPLPRSQFCHLQKQSQCEAVSW